MDTSKFKSVIVPREVYDDLRQEATKEGRTISGHLRMVLDYYNSHRKRKKG